MTRSDIITALDHLDDALTHLQAAHRAARQDDVRAGLHKAERAQARLLSLLDGAADLGSAEVSHRPGGLTPGSP